MASFVFCQYSGDDAGEVLARLFGKDEELTTDLSDEALEQEQGYPKHKAVGFQIETRNG